MDRLQRMAEFTRKQKGKGIVLRGNDTCVLLTDRGPQPLNKVMTPEEIDALLRESAPASLTSQLGGCEPLIFSHPTAEGPLTVSVSRAEGRLEVTVALPGETIAAGAAPPLVVFPIPGPPTVAAPGDLAPVAPAAPPVEVPPPTAAPAPPPPDFPSGDFPPAYVPGLIRAAVAARASDVYLHVGTKPWGRIHGEVQPLDYGLALTPEQLEAALFDLIPPERRRRWVDDGAVEFCLTFEDCARVRCSVFSDVRGLCASLRLLPVKPVSLEELQTPGFVADLARAERGLVLLAGVRSSGVTTTLAAILHAINAERRARIVTIESPVEYLHAPARSLVTQVEVPSQAPTVAAALRRLAQANADVCAIGDLSDPEALALAVALAEGGLLVLGVLRAPDVPAVMEQGVDGLAVAGSRSPADRLLHVLRGVVCQRLCWARRGGRPIALFEMLSVSPTVASLVRQGKFRELHGAMFMTFDNALGTHVREGKITREEALRYATDPETLRRLLGGDG